MSNTAAAQEARQQSGERHVEPIRREYPRKRAAMVLGGLVLLAALIWGVQKWVYGRAHISTDNAQVNGHLVPVLARVGGFVAAVSVSENQHVQAGDPLVRLDDAELQQRLLQARADLAAAEATAGIGSASGQAVAQVTAAERQQAAVSAQLEAARSSAARADRDLERLEQLAAQQIASRQQLDAARTAAENAHSAVRALEQQRSGAGAVISGAQAGVRLAAAKVQAARATVENARLQLSYASIMAPESGTVAKRSVEPGQLVQPGQPLMVVVADTGLYVTANFKETQLSHLRPGQPVEVDVDAYGSCTAEGVVESIGAATGSQFALLPADNATGNFTKVVQRVPVRIRVTRGCGEAEPLRPGLSVVVHVATRGGQGA